MPLIDFIGKQLPREVLLHMCKDEALRETTVVAMWQTLINHMNYFDALRNHPQTQVEYLRIWFKGPVSLEQMKEYINDIL